MFDWKVFLGTCEVRGLGPALTFIIRERIGRTELAPAKTIL